MMLSTFKKFLSDEQASDMYITGRAGTGKTTDLVTLVQHCTDNSLPYTVCAFTHKACGILRAKLAQGSRVQTLWSYLKKRPGVNQNAQSHKHIDTNAQSGRPEALSIVFIDEWSMVGERDLMSLREAQDEHPGLKLVWLGDPNQLPPVGDRQTVKPHGKYCVTLSHVYRTAEDNPLTQTLDQLISFIEGATPEPLIESDNFIRRQDIVEWYNNDDNDDKVLLAYTNRRVEDLNAEVQGYYDPKPGDRLYSPTTKGWYTFIGWEDCVSHVMLPFGEPLALNSKYKTLEHLIKQGYRFALVTNEEDEIETFATVFGHYQHKMTLDQLKRAAANSNAAIGDNATEWAQANKSASKAKTRAQAWRNFLSFNEAVICLDFAHAMTVHKSQGSTYRNVYLDTEDIGIAANIDYTLYLKLMYVGSSRASNEVVTN